MTDIDELMEKASEILKNLDGKYSVIEILIILKIAVSLYEGSAIKNSINAKKKEGYDSFYL